jgi:cell fate regulator YaaT (PSP1 superfamily)
MLPLPVVQPAAAAGAAHLVEVVFKGGRRDFFTTRDDALAEGDHVIVETDRGQDLGRIKSVGGVARKKCGEGAASARPIVRVALPEEVQRLMVLRSDEERVRRKVREMVEQHKLRMKVTEAEWQWDRNKLILYFTAERRVDFRQLVRELARNFRTRIELKQIGVRDEAALLGGVGRCGRELCCSTWLREIKPISLQLAKDQNLSLNPAQISGTCGRLMCCLTYEHDAYLQARKRFPREGRTITTSVGSEKVIGIDIWHDQVTLLDENRERRTVGLVELRAEIDEARQQ